MKFSVIITFTLIGLTVAVKDFQPKNADEAEKLTEEFKKLTPDSPCSNGDQACINDQFAQCVDGQFALNSCGGGDLKCVVLPLVNKPGTSITCSTEEDRQNRLDEARGETSPEQSKQPDGNDNDNIETPDQPSEGENNNNETPENDKGEDEPPENDNDNNADQPDQPDQPQSPENDKGQDDAKQPENFKEKNADDAEKLTEEFKKLTPDSPCNNGDQACINDQFAQCVDGKFALNSCGGGDLKCVVLPLVNKPGTSITCSTEEDRQNRLDEARGETSPEPSKQPEGNDNDNIETPDQPSEGGNDNNETPENDKGEDEPTENDNDNNADQPDQPDQPQNPENDKGNESSAEIRKKNADEAEKKQKEFESFTPDQKCTDNEIACVDNKLAQCVNEKFTLTDCGPGLQCSVLPLVLKEGTTIACTTEADRQARLDEARNNKK